MANRIIEYEFERTAEKRTTEEICREMKDPNYTYTCTPDDAVMIFVSYTNDFLFCILYISPETLLSRSDVVQLIGDRTIGMIVIDEAHIVTTWGKQFRPDYWYLGDHIKMLRKNQLKNKGRAFVIATFTATAIYHGLEDMYTETINSLHMLNGRNKAQMVYDSLTGERLACLKIPAVHGEIIYKLLNVTARYLVKAKMT